MSFVDKKDAIENLKKWVANSKRLTAICPVKNDYSKTKLCRNINGGLSGLLKLPSNILFQFMTKLFRMSFPITVGLNELLAPPINRSGLAIAFGVLENIGLPDVVVT